MANINHSDAAGGGGGIKSVSRGILTIAPNAASASVTIPAVVPEKTELRLLGFNSNSAVDAQSFPVLSLASATSITAQKYTVTSATIVVRWEMTEWN